MTFDDIRKAFDWLVNVKFEELPIEQRKKLRVPKNNFNHGDISHQQMEKILAEFGNLEKTFKFELK